MELQHNPYAAPRAELFGVVDDDDEFQEVRLLAISGRIGRIRYLSYMTGVYLLFAVALGVVAAALGSALRHNPTALMVVIGIGYFVMVVLLVMLAIQRCHDFDKSGWCVLLFLVPLINFFFGLYLVFNPGTDGRNRFGARTPPNSTVSVIIACVLPAMFFLGILAAIALPAYSDYTRRAHMRAPH